MKQFKYILLQLIVVMGFATSCQESEVDDGVSLDMSNEFSLLSFGGDYTTTDDGKLVIITTSTSWTAQADSDWIMLSQSSGSTSGKNSFYVGVEANNSSSTRYGTIEIASGYERLTIVVSQTHNQYIDVARDSYSYDGREQTFSVLVSTNVGAGNVAVTIPSADKEWLSCSSPVINTIDENVSELNYTFKVEAQAEGEAARESSVVISYSKVGVGATFTVTQNQMPTITVEDLEDGVEDNSFMTNYYTTSFDVVVDANIDLILEEVDAQGELVANNSTWITTPDEFSASGTLKTYTFAMKSNATINAKDYYVRFGYYTPDAEYIDQLVDYEIVQITQPGKVVEFHFNEADSLIYIEPQTYIANSNFNVDIYSNVELTATSNATSWLTVASGYSTVDIDEDDTNGDDKIYTYTFVLTQNDAAGNTERSATVTFTNTVDPSKSTSLTITQEKEKMFVSVTDKNDIMESQPYTANNSFQISVTSNDGEPTSVVTPSWMTQLGNAISEATEILGVDKYTYTFSIDENFAVGATERSDDVTFTTTSAESDYVTVTQQARVPEVTINNFADVNGVTQLFNIGELTLNVSSDIPLSASVAGGTISPESLLNSEFETITTDYIVAISDNESSDTQQTITVTFSNIDYGYSQEVVIYQDVMPSTFSVENSAAGLASLLDEVADYSLYSRIVVTGEPLTSDDFATITTKFTNVAYIDISATATTEIPASQFKSNTALIQFLFPDGASLATIGANAFDGSGLTSVSLPASITEVGDYAFANTASLKSIVFEDESTIIGKWMFQNAKALTFIKFATSITTIGEKAFQNTTALTSVDLSGLKVIGYHMFNGAGLTTVTIPASVETWGVDELTTTEYHTSMAFQACTSLLTIELEDGLKTLPSGIVANCSALVSMTSYSVTPPTMIYGQYSTTNEVVEFYPMNSGSVGKTIYVPEAGMDAYKEAEGWIRHANKYVSIESLSATE